jgi:riboflavin synthase
MFTGLVEEVGKIDQIRPHGPGVRLTIGCARVLDGMALGDSVAVNGACLTATEITATSFSVDAVPETMSRTAIGTLAPGDPVNLERAMRLGDRLGGHLVQGHIDGTGMVVGATPEGESLRVRISMAPGLRKYVVDKGSIAIDGISLTVAECHEDGLSVALIPHTMVHTTLGPTSVGRVVNLEVDLLAKYVAQLVQPYQGS